MQVTETTSSKGKSHRWIPIVLFATAGLPVVLASIMYFTGSMIPQERSNKGTLVVPPLAVQKLELQLQQAGEGDVEGKWELMVFGRDNCASKSCQEVLYKTHQVNVALGREADRVVRRYINIGGVLDDAAVQEIRAGYPRLHLSYASELKLEVFLDKVVDASQVANGNFVFVADPLGNVMMYYTQENPGGDMLDDLKKLLKVSNIG